MKTSESLIYATPKSIAFSFTHLINVECLQYGRHGVCTYIDTNTNGFKKTKIKLLFFHLEIQINGIEESSINMFV